MTDRMTRREALKRVGLLLGGAVAAPISAGVLGGCTARGADDVYRPRVLDARQDELVTALAERIIPETDTPGARTARVNTFIDDLLADWYPDDDRARFLAGLEDVETRAQDAHGKAFAACTPEEQDAVVLALDREAFPEAYGVTSASGAAESASASFFKTFKQLTLVGYYTSEVGATQELHVNPMGVYRGDVPYNEIGRVWA